MACPSHPCRSPYVQHARQEYRGTQLGQSPRWKSYAMLANRALDPSVHPHVAETTYSRGDARHSTAPAINVSAVPYSLH
jgi:hypothetical protein